MFDPVWRSQAGQLPYDLQRLLLFYVVLSLFISTPSSFRKLRASSILFASPKAPKAVSDSCQVQQELGTVYSFYSYWPTCTYFISLSVERKALRLYLLVRVLVQRDELVASLFVILDGRPVNRLSVWGKDEKIAEKIPFIRDFFTLSQERACSQARWYKNL